MLLSIAKNFSFTYSTFMDCLLCARNSIKQWIYNSKQKRQDSCPHGLAVQLFFFCTAYVDMNTYSRIALFLNIPLMG